MAESSNSSGGVSVLSFVVGALLVAVVGLGIFMYMGGNFGGQQASGPTLNIEVENPTVRP